jgi:DNA-binding HxlR family transcriptional regulator
MLPSSNDTPEAIDSILQRAAEKPIDIDSLWRAIRKLSNRDTMIVVQVLADESMTFSELQAAAGLNVNRLNHILYDMKQMNLIIPIGEMKGQRKYYLTRYCKILLNTLVTLQREINSVSKEVFREYI